MKFLTRKPCVLEHKIREAMGLEFRRLRLREARGVESGGLRLGGAGRQVEVDGACFGGPVRPEDRKEDRKDRRLAENKSGKRQVVVVIRERALAGTSLGGTLPAVFVSEDAAIDFIKARGDRATTAHADEAAAWNALHARFDTRRINHSVEYANDDACTNGAESFFSRARRGEIGHYHHLSGVYLLRYARELAWREDHRKGQHRSAGPHGGAAGGQQRPVGGLLRLLAARPPRRLISPAPAR